MDIVYFESHVGMCLVTHLALCFIAVPLLVDDIVHGRDHVGESDDSHENLGRVCDGKTQAMRHELDDGRLICAFERMEAPSYPSTP